MNQSHRAASSSCSNPAAPGTVWVQTGQLYEAEILGEQLREGSDTSAEQRYARSVSSSMIATFGLNLSEPHSKSAIVRQMSTESGLSRMKEVYVALHESRGTVPLCRRPHGWVAALVINRYGEDSSL